MVNLVRKLIATGECEYLDFKVQWHSTGADLIHDILCLANARHDGDRYLLIGVADDKTIAGVPDIHRRNQEQLNTLLRSKFNIMPSVRVATVEIDNKKIDVVSIKDLPEKPYFLRLDYKNDGAVVRAGVVYSRIADGNVPKDGSLDDKKIEEIYRERFRLDRSPIERLLHMLDDSELWEMHGEATTTFFHAHWPEMKIIQESNDDVGYHPYDVIWAKVFFDKNAFRYPMDVVYFGTTLRTIQWITCDGGRYQTIAPQKKSIKTGDSEWRHFYYFVEDELEFKVNRLIQALMQHDDSINPDFIVFPNAKVAENFFAAEGRKDHVPVNYYMQTGTGETYKEYRIYSSGKKELLHENAETVG